MLKIFPFHLISLPTRDVTKRYQSILISHISILQEWLQVIFDFLNKSCLRIADMRIIDVGHYGFDLRSLLIRLRKIDFNNATLLSLDWGEEFV